MHTAGCCFFWFTVKVLVLAFDRPHPRDIAYSELWDFFAWYFHDKAAKLKYSFEVFRFWHFHFHEKVWNFHPNVGSTLLAVEVEGVTTTFSSVTTTCALNLLRLSSPLPSSPHPHSWKLLEFSFYAAGLNNLWQPGSRAARKWRENEKMKRKWREKEEMERKWGSAESEFLSTSSFSLHFVFIFSISPFSRSPAARLPQVVQPWCYCQK